MANITPTQTLILPVDGIGDSTVDGWKVVWGPCAAGDVGLPVQLPGYADKSIQVTGTAPGGTASCEGSNDGGNNWSVLSQPNGSNAIITLPGSATVPTIIAITEATIQVRPNLTSTTGTALFVTMFFRKTQQNMK
jgi:hypothetical protein